MPLTNLNFNLEHLLIGVAVGYLVTGYISGLRISKYLWDKDRYVGLSVSDYRLSNYLDLFIVGPLIHAFLWPFTDFAKLDRHISELRRLRETEDKLAKLYILEDMVAEAKRMKKLGVPDDELEAYAAKIEDVLERYDAKFEELEYGPRIKVVRISKGENNEN